MAIDPEGLLNWPFPEVEQAYSAKDSMFYALSVGVGHDPLDQDQLRFVYERDLLAMPSMAAVLAHPGFWVKDSRTGIHWEHVLHGEQDMTWHKPLPAEGNLVARARVTELIDKGEGRGMVMLWERELRDADTGDLYATVAQSTFCRKDGGFGGTNRPTPPPAEIPQGPPAASCDLPTFKNSALIYRLNGDDNPLHADPDVARKAGFKAPILHGLCTLGVATHGVLKLLCNYQPERLKRLALRFSAPVYPGETLRTEVFWPDATGAAFRVRVPERDVTVISHGRAEVSTP